MFKKEIIKKDGKIYEVIWQDAYGKRLNVNYIADIYEDEKPKVENKKRTKKVEDE